MTHKWNKVSRRMVFIWCLLGGLICLFAPRSWTDRLQLAYAHVFSWPLEAGRHLSLATRGVPTLHATGSAGGEGWAGERQALKSRISDLENHVSNLEAQIREADGEIDELSRISVEPQWKRMTFLRADTIPGQTPDVLFINRGGNDKDKVAVGQYVLGNMSVIGIVSEVSARTAMVRLITHPDLKIPVTVGKSDLARVMEGRSGGTARIPFVQATHTIRQGDKVYAKKKPGLLDAPIVVGTVTQSRLDPEDPTLLDITVQPACDIATLTKVAVIVSAPQQQ